jgi:hypothetical protein
VFRLENGSFHKIKNIVADSEHREPGQQSGETGILQASVVQVIVRGMFDFLIGIGR